MRHKFSRFLYLSLALIIALSLCACGKDRGSDDPNHYNFGKYTLDYKGACIMSNEYGEDALVMTFQFTNNAKENASYGWTIYEKVIQNGIELESTYVVTDWETYESVSGTYFTDVTPGNSIEVRVPYKLNGTETVEVTLSDLWDKYSHTITVNPAELEREEIESSDSGLDDFDSAETISMDEETLSTVASFTDWWEGDWYGWWVISSGSGDYENYGGYWWDVCARIVTYDDQSGRLVLWDTEDGSMDNACCLVDVSFNEAGTGSHGTMMSESGAFMDHILEHADWIVDPGLEKIDDLIWIDGSYDGENGSYNYEIFLRPWGVTWDDMNEEITGYDVFMPDTYDWYLSLINASQPMPDSFEDDSESRTGTDDQSDDFAYTLDFDLTPWLDQGWLGPLEIGLAGTDVLEGMNWWITPRDNSEISYCLRFCPNSGSTYDGEVIMDCFYDGDDRAQGHWEGWWYLDTMLDSASTLHIDLLLMDCLDQGAFETSAILSEDCMVLVHPSGESLLLVTDPAQTNFPFFPSEENHCELTLETE